MRAFFRKRLFGGLLLAGLGAFSPVAPLLGRAAEPPPLIPREVLFGNPEIIGVSLSPDGRRIAYLAPDQGVLNLGVRDLDGDAPPAGLNPTAQPPPTGSVLDRRWALFDFQP